MEAYDHDLTDPAWLDEFLQEDLNSTAQTQKPSNQQAFLQQPPLPHQGQQKAYKRSQSVASVFTVDEGLYNHQNDSRHLLERFRYLKKRQKLNLQKLSEMFRVPKAELQKFSSGKDPNCAFLDRIRNWVYSPSNSDALRCFERDNRRAVLSSISASQQQQQQQSLAPTSSFNRASPVWSGYDAYKASVSSGQEYKNSLYYSQQHTNVPQRGQMVSYNLASGTTSSIKHQALPSGRGSSSTYVYPEQMSSYMRAREQAGNLKRESNEPLKTNTGTGVMRYDRSSKSSYHNNESIEVLSQMLKRDTHKLLHKGIDSAIEEYLAGSKALRNKIKSEGVNSRESDYFFKTQGKVLLNRLTAICGEEAVNRATSYLSELKSKREASKSARNRANIEMQKLAYLTKAWNHACSCKDSKCAYPNCRKIKPAVLHQLRLKDERRRSSNPSLRCTIPNCEPCILYNKLKKFSGTTKTVSAQMKNNGFVQQNHGYSTKPGQHQYNADSQHLHGSSPHSQSAVFSGSRQNVENQNSLQLARQRPFTHNRSSYSSHHQKYSSSNNFTQRGYRNRRNSRTQQIYNQQNNITTNMQNINNTNVSYNTYNIHTNSTPTGKSDVKTEVEETDMSAVAEMLDEKRKHNVNINVNVSVEPLYGGGSHKRKIDPKQEYNYEFAKDKRSKNDGNNDGDYNFDPSAMSHQANKEPGVHNKDVDEVDPASFIPDVEDDLADLFHDTSALSGPDIPISETSEVLNQVQDNDKLNLMSGRATDGNGRRVLCVVCHGKERDALFKPCNHCCACMNCALKLRSCPMCRAAVDSTSHIYLS